MAEVAPPAAPTTLAKPKKVAKPRPKSGTGVKEQIMKIMTSSKDRKGISYIRLKKELAAQGYDVEHNSAHIKRAVRGLIENNTLKQLRGNGATGSFKVCTAPANPKKTTGAKAAGGAKAARAKSNRPKKPVGAKAAAKKPVVANKSKVIKTTKATKAAKATNKGKTSKKVTPAKTTRGGKPVTKRQPAKKAAPSPKSSKKPVKKGPAAAPKTPVKGRARPKGSVKK